MIQCRITRVALACALLAAAAASVAAVSASAQDTTGQMAGMVAAAGESLGQGVGAAVRGGQSIFVTATGHEELPAAPVSAYAVTIDGRSPSAVDAARLRDDRLKTAKALAQKYGINPELGAATFSREIDQAAQQKRFADIQAERQAHPGTVIPQPIQADAERVFVARTVVRFHATDTSQFPAFLDALKAAGIDDTDMSAVNGLTGFPTMTAQIFGFGSVESVDDATWDRASQKALASALHQAEVLAKASGHSVGDVQQIMVLAKSVQGTQAHLTIAVRYALH